jgi:hypothetical protein
MRSGDPDRHAGCAGGLVAGLAFSLLRLFEVMLLVLFGSREQVGGFV